MFKLKALISIALSHTVVFVVLPKITKLAYELNYTENSRNQRLFSSWCCFCWHCGNAAITRAFGSFYILKMFSLLKHKMIWRRRWRCNSDRGCIAVMRRKHFLNERADVERRSTSIMYEPENITERFYCLYRLKQLWQWPDHAYTDSQQPDYITWTVIKRSVHCVSK